MHEVRDGEVVREVLNGGMPGQNQGINCPAPASAFFVDGV